jgi:hypothetical protein
MERYTSELELTIRQTRHWAGSLSILKHGNSEDIAKCGIAQNWLRMMLRTFQVQLVSENY